MGGRSSAAAPTRYAGIQVQTSALGVQMTIGWGTFRAKCNLIWYGDFKSKAQKSSAGKGGGSTTTGYSYSASMIMGLCEGPIADITTVWVNSSQYVGGNGAALRQAGLTMANGAIGQSTWSYLTSSHPSQAIGYSGLCIAYASNYPLDSGAGTPNHSFEVVSTIRLSSLGLPDANPKDIIADFFQNARYGLPSWPAGLLDPASLAFYGTYCLASNLVVSPCLDQQRTGSDFLSELFLATNSTCVWSEGVLKFIPYGDTAVTGNGVTFTPNLTPVYSLGPENFIPQADGDDPLLIDIEDQSNAYNIVQLEYLDRTNQYNSSIASAQDLANIGQFGRRKQDPTTVHCICTPAVANLSAQLYLQRTLYVRAQYKFDLDWSFALLEPGDIVELTDPGQALAAYPVRIIQIDDDENTRRSVVAEDLLVGVSHAPLYNNQEGRGYVTDHSIDPGGVEANLALWSEDLTQSVYTQVATTVAANAAVDPLFGATTADKLIPSATSGYHQIQQAVASPFSGVAYTFAVYVKPAGRRCVQVYLGDGTGNNASLIVDTSSGAILQALTNAGTAVGKGSAVVSAGTGWYRIAVTVTFTSPPNIYAVVRVCDDSGAQAWTGDGVSGVYVWGWQLKQGVDVPVYAYTAGSIAGPFLFNPPAALAAGPQSEACAAASGGANWGGCYVWVSADGANYQNMGVIDTAARFGFVKASYPAHSDPDTTETLSIDVGLSAGVIAGGTTADADAATTLCLVDNELIAYSSATLTAQGRYDLSGYVRRGVMNSPIAAHANGSTFIRLDEAIFNFPYIAAAAGKLVYVKFQSFNHWGAGLQDLSVCNPYTITLDPVGNGSGIAAGANRLCFSEFEHGANDGWFTGYNPAGIATARNSGSYQGFEYNQLLATATAAGQSVSQKSISFPVTGGERIAVMARCQLSANATGYVACGFKDANGLGIAEPEAFGVATGGGYTDLYGGFLSVPSNAVQAWFEFYATSTAAGGLVLNLVQPMVCGAAAEQTTFPTFTKGPAGEYGADITGNWTAAAIVGQAAAATDTTIQSGATKNVVTVGATAPVLPTQGDLWNDTSTSPATWKAYFGGAWQLASTVGGVFSSNLYESLGGSAATLANFKTVLGTAAAITGQSPWATSGIPTSILTNPTANLIYNPSAALGDQDWAPSLGAIGVVTSGGGNQTGTYFVNYASTNSTGCSQYQNIPCFAGVPYSLSASLYSAGLTGAGAQVRIYVQWLDSGGAHIGYSGVVALAPGNGWTQVQTPNQISPAGAATARVWMDIASSGAWTNSGAACAWSQLKLEQNTVCTPYSDETTNGALHRDGNTIDYWRPAQQGADVTNLNIAAGITGQQPAATDGTIQPGATNNPTFRQGADPYAGGLVPDGAFWFNTSTGVPYISGGGAWHIFTPQIADGTVVVTGSGPSGGTAVSGSYTVPSNFQPFIQVALTAASGGAGDVPGNDNTGAGGGASVHHMAVSPGDTISWTLGAHGSNGGANVNGGGGAGSIASSSTGMSLTCVGGGGGPKSPAGATGTPGGASGGNVSNTTGATIHSQNAVITLTAKAT